MFYTNAGGRLVIYLQPSYRLPVGVVEMEKRGRVVSLCLLCIECEPITSQLPAPLPSVGFGRGRVPSYRL